MVCTCLAVSLHSSCSHQLTAEQANACESGTVHPCVAATDTALSGWSFVRGLEHKIVHKIVHLLLKPCFTSTVRSNCTSLAPWSAAV